MRGFSFALLFGASSCSWPHQRPQIATLTPSNHLSPAVPCTCAAPPPPATYIVFFDWSKYALRPKSIAIIALVASDDKAISFGHITIFGNIDTSEAFAGDTSLSLARALAVRDQLIADGVAPAKIEIQSNGSEHLIVPTGPNVRLADNRSVVIEGDKVRYGLPSPPGL